MGEGDEMKRLELYVYPNRDGNETAHTAELLRAVAAEIESDPDDLSREIEIEAAGIAHLKVWRDDDRELSS
jgi:hypothetical protein